MTKLEKILRLITLTGWLIAFAWLLQAGDSSGVRNLADFLNPKLWWLIAGGLWMTVLLLVATAARTTSNTSQFPWRAVGQNAVLLLPLLFFPLALNKNLSASALQTRLSPSQLGLPGRATKEPSPLEMAEELSRQLGAPPNLEEQENDQVKEVPLSFLMLSPEKYEGRQVEVIGMVHRDPSLPANSFLCLRLIMTCCIADARPVGAMVTYTGQQPLPPADSWVRLRGRFQIKPLNGVSFPCLEANRLETIKEPDFPYLFM